MHRGFHPGFTPGFRSPVIDPRFVPRRLDRFEDRFESRFPFGRFDRFEDRLENRLRFAVLPHFVGGFMPGFPGMIPFGSPDCSRIAARPPKARTSPKREYGDRVASFAGASGCGKGSVTGTGMLIINASAKSSDTISISGQGSLTLSGLTRNGVEVPAEHLACGLVRPVVDADGRVFDAQELTRGHAPLCPSSRQAPGIAGRPSAQLATSAKEPFNTSTDTSETASGVFLTSLRSCPIIGFYRRCLDADFSSDSPSNSAADSITARSLMSTTSLGLLDRLKEAPPGADDWGRLHDLYLPLLRKWLSQVPGLRDEADDLTQEIFVALLRGLPAFERRRHGAFRAWLRQITVNRIRTFWKDRRKQPAAGLAETDRLLEQLEDPASHLSQQWERDHDRHVYEKLVQIVQPDFEAQTWRAFTRFALDGVSAADTARELGMTETAVLQAKFRVLKRLREEAGELLD
jgi:RNA polymerase sigma-70 factor (ECF subfamily)